MRSYREFWLWLGAALLAIATVLVEIALAYFTTERHFFLYTSWQMLAGALLFVAAFVCFLGAISEWTFPPWATPRFPNLKIDIQCTQHQSTVCIGKKLSYYCICWVYTVRITNLDREQNANLTARLYFRRSPNSSGRVKEVATMSPDFSRRNSPYDSSRLECDPLPNIISLSPGTTLTGDLVFRVEGVKNVRKLSAPLSARLEVEDHILGKRMGKVFDADFRAPSISFTRKDMHWSDGMGKVLSRDRGTRPPRAVLRRRQDSSLTRPRDTRRVLEGKVIR